MKFDKKNSKFLTDLFTILLAVTVIVSAVIVIINGSEILLAVVFYSGAAMFATNIIRGFISRRYTSLLFVVPIAMCIAGGLAAQGVINPWIY